MARLLVTGGAGFIGSNLVQFLSQKGEEVTVVDNFSTGRRTNLQDVKDHVHIIDGDIRDRDLMRELFAEIDVVYHQAALPSVPRSVDDPWATNDHNVNGTLSVFLAARDAGVRRVVYATSSSAYGDGDDLPKEESMCSAPSSPYSVSKYVGELYGTVFNDIYDIETVGLRYFNVFGPRQDPSSDYAAAIPKFIDRYLHGQPPIIYGDGEQTRDFTFVENVVQANWKAAHAPGEAVNGEIFNVGCGQQITVNQLVQMLKYITGADVEPVHDEPRPAEVRHSQANIQKAHDAFGYVPEVDVREGLRRTVDWFKSAHEEALNGS
jgi:UDP-glucose 4-epimerase